MPTNEDRLWDVAIGEAVTGRQPPDLLAMILARSIEPARASPPRPRWQRITWRALQISAAAGVVLAIGVLTGLVKWPSSAPGETPEPRNLIAAPGAKWHLEGSAIMLESGELLLSKGAPEVRREDSTFAMIDGLALVRAGREPTPDQNETLKAWLETKGVEAAMIRNATKWLQGTALCALMLQGSATLDGQKVEAEKPAAEPVWRTVHSVMDIEKLPKEATHVSLVGQDAGLVDFLSERSGIEALNLANARGLTPPHLTTLKALPKLQSLELRGCRWSQGPADYSGLLELPALKSVAIDVIKRVESSVTYAEAGWFREQLPVLKQLSARGVEIGLGEVNARVLQVSELVEAVPKLRDLKLADATNADLKLVASLGQLRVLELRDGAYTDLGLAYLARGLRLTHLRCELGKLAEWYQVGRMESLQDLSISNLDTSDLTEHFGQLAPLKNLRRLDLTGIRSGNRAHPPVSVLSPLPTLDCLRIEYEPAFRDFWGNLSAVNARRLEYVESDFVIPSLNAEIINKSTQSKLEVIAFEWLGVRDSDEVNVLGDVLAACPSLQRIEVRAAESCEAEAVKLTLDKMKKAAPTLKIELVR